MLYNEDMTKKARAFKAGQLEIILRDDSSSDGDTASTTDDETSDDTVDSSEAEYDPLS